MFFSKLQLENEGVFEKIKNVYRRTEVALFFCIYFVAGTLNLFELSVEHCSYTVERKAPGKEPETEKT